MKRSPSSIAKRPGSTRRKESLSRSPSRFGSVEHRSLIATRSWLLASETNEAEAVNGIPPALTRSVGIARARMTPELVSYVATADAIVAHNAQFDRAWLPELHDKTWMCSKDDFEWPRSNGNNSLIALALAHGVGVASAHRALADVSTMVLLFERVAELMVEFDRGRDDNGGDDYGFRLWLENAARPRAVFEVAEKNFDAARNEQAKAQGFRWVAEKKSWQRRLAIEDAKTMPFRVQRVAQ